MSPYKNTRLALATATAAALVGGLLSLSTAASSTASAAETPSSGTQKTAMYVDDYNGDGYRDYASSDDLGFMVTYGTAKGPGTRQSYINQDSPGIPGSPVNGEDEYDTFGFQLANADFNQDGYADLAVTDHSETVGGRKDQGAVTIVWGSRTGLSQGTRLRAPIAQPNRHFGYSLAAGDFNGDGRPDLAVGDRDSVHVYRGGFSPASGAIGRVTRHQPHGGGTFVALRLVAGKVTQDKATDLYAIGVTRSQGSSTTAWFLKGGPTVTSGPYLAYTPTRALHPQAVIADFDKDGYGDLAVGDEQYDKNAGSVVVLRGGANGPAGSTRIGQATAGVTGTPERGDFMGQVLSAGDVNRDGYPDLAVSAPGEKIGSTVGAGGVHVLRGGKKGLTGTASQWFHLGTAGVPGTAGPHSSFGTYVRLRDVDRDGDADLLASHDSHKALILPGGAAGIAVKGVREVRVTAEFVQ